MDISYYDWDRTMKRIAALETQLTKEREKVQKAVSEEREAVVRWLRANENTYWANRNYSGAADNIEKGEHRK